MRAIFISYRRDDTEGEAGRLFSDLTKHFGADRVFMDVTGIEPGRDFRKVIDQHVATCGVLLAMIGPQWVSARNSGGQRRLDDPIDFVRLETASALKRDIPVIPVLVHEAKMPRVDEVPDDLKDLCYRSAVELTHARWDSDVQLLIKALGLHSTAIFNAPWTAPAAAPTAAAPPLPPQPPVTTGYAQAAPVPLQTPVVGLAPAVSKGLKIGICIASVLNPILGVVMGILYMKDANPEKKAVGKLWLIVSICAFVFSCFFWSAISNSTG
jgi:TIR domain